MPEKKRPKRFTRMLEASKLEFRAEDDKPVLHGTAAVFNERTELWPGMFEQIAVGAFARALKDKQDVFALVNHDSNQILGRTKSGTLELHESRHGLEATIRPPDTETGRAIVELIRRGDVDKMSFAFSPIKESFEEMPDGTLVRTLEDVDLFDVSAVNLPAYPGTNIESNAKKQGLLRLNDTSDAEAAVERWRAEQRAATDRRKAEFADLRERGII